MADTLGVTDLQVCGEKKNIKTTHAQMIRLIAYHVLVGDREQVALLVAELCALLCHSLHGSRHVVIALGLLCQLGFLHQVALIHLLDCKKKETRVRTSPLQLFIYDQKWAAKLYRDRELVRNRCGNQRF